MQIGTVIDAASTDIRSKLIGAPLVGPVLAFCAGIVLDQYYSPYLPILLAVTIACALGVFVFRARANVRAVLLIAFAGAAGAVHHAAMLRCVPHNHIRHWAAAKPVKTDLTGVVVSPPFTRWQEKTYPYHTSPRIYTSFVVRAEQLDLPTGPIRTCGMVSVTVFGIHDRYRPGMRVKLTGKIEPTEPYVRWPGILRTSSPPPIDPNRVHMWVSPWSQIKILSRQAGSFRAMKDRLKQVAYAMLVGDGDQSDPHARSLLSAMVLGRRYQVERTINRAFQAAGASHFLAVSGFHLAVLASAVWVLASWFGMSRRSAAYLVLLVVWVYVGVNETRPPIVRAAIIATFACLAILTRRPSSPINWVAASALIILMVSPNQLFTVGFQLSYVALAGLLLFCRRLHVAIFGLVNPDISASLQVYTYIDTIKLIASPTRAIVTAMITATITASIVAWAAAMPIIMTYFNMVSFIGPVSCVVIAPFAMLLIVLGFVQMVVTAVVGHPLFLPFLTGPLSAALSKIVQLLAHIPAGHLHVVPPPTIIIVLYYALLGWLAFSPRPDPAELLLASPTYRDRFRRLIRPGLKVNLLLALVAGYLAFWAVTARAVPGQSDNTSQITLASRSQGQLAAVRTGRDMIVIDCGVGRMNEAVEMVEDIQTKYLATARAIFLTVPEQRFFNDLANLVPAIGRIPIYTTGAFEPLRPLYQPIDELFGSNVLTPSGTMGAGEAVTIDGTTVTLLYPTEQVVRKILAADRDGRGTGGMKGAKMVHRLHELGGVVYVETPATRIIVSSVLGPVACELIITHWPDLHADVLVTHAMTRPGPTFTQLMQDTGVARLIVCGRLSPTARGRFDQISRQLAIPLTVVAPNRTLQVRLPSAPVF